MGEKKVGKYPTIQIDQHGQNHFKQPFDSKECVCEESVWRVEENAHAHEF